MSEADLEHGGELGEPEPGPAPGGGEKRERAGRHGQKAPVLRLLADERTRTLVGALADGPCRPSQLERLLGVGRGPLYTRLAALTTLGMCAPYRFAQFPLRVEYRLSDAGRALFANELLLERQERRRLAGVGPAVGGALSDLLRLLAPISRIARAGTGSCMFVEREPPTPDVSARLVIDDGAIALSEPASPDKHGARVTATPDAWSEALLAGTGDGLKFAGDSRLARAVLASLVSALALDAERAASNA